MDNKCSEESCINCIHKSKYGNICYKDMQNIKEINNPEKEVCNDFSRIEE